MESDFDKKLRTRISEVFNKIEEPAANYGWQKLREKYPPQNERRRGAWWWAAAALVILGIGFWLTGKNVTSENVVIKPLKRKEQLVVLGNKSSKDPFNTRNKKGMHEDKIQKARPLKLIAHTGGNGVNLKYHPASHKKSVGVVIKDSTAATLQAAIALKVTDSVNLANKQLQIDNFKDKSLNLSLSQNNAAKNKVNDSLSIAAMFNADIKQRDLKETQKQLPAKTVTFDVYATTFFNYAKGSSNQFNAGAGFSASVIINKNISFVTGLSVAQNSLSYDGQTLSIAQSSSFYSGNTPGAAQSGSASTILTNYNANLVGIDIPLNLKFSLNNQNNASFYVLAGFSSGTFINESYTYQYNYQSSSTASAEQSQTSNKGLGNFYFAKTINAAFGLGYPLGKNRLFIEPFLKYPLSGLGAEQLKFGAGGINLKFNFQSSKK